MYDKLAKYAPNAQVIKAHTGQELKFGSVSAEILYTIEDYLPGTLDTLNTSSMVIRLTIAGQTTLLLADTTHRSGYILENMWGDYLKSDVVQIAHHGIWPSNSTLYDDVKAEVLLWPTHNYCAKDMLAERNYNAVIENALSYAKDVYVSNDNVTVVALPFAITNNKEAVRQAIKEAKGPNQ